MSRTHFFLISSAIILIFERVLPALVFWPIFIFPVFVILFMLASKNVAGELVSIVAVSLVFDFFSGYTLGFITLAVLVVMLGILLFKTRFNVSPQSFFSLLVYSLFFVFVYLAILSIKSSPRFIISQAPTIIIETVMLFCIFTFAFRKLIKTA